MEKNPSFRSIARTDDDSLAFRDKSHTIINT